jgi:hypothetical protein
MSTPNWDRLWSSAGMQFVLFFIVAYFIYGDQPKVGSSLDALVSFYDGNRTRILIATSSPAWRSLTFSGSQRRSRSVVRDAAKTAGGRP